MQRCRLASAPAMQGRAGQRCSARGGAAGSSKAQSSRQRDRRRGGGGQPDLVVAAGQAEGAVIASLQGRGVEKQRLKNEGFGSEQGVERQEVKSAS